MSKTDEQPAGTDLAKRESELAAGALAAAETSDLVLPILQVTQQTSRAVRSGEFEAGHFVNSLTGDDYGEETDIIVVHFFKGRFFAPEDEDRVYVASSDVAPNNWPDQFAGKPFADIPEAEEQWKARANDPDDDLQWGSGPPIQTTWNFIGFLPQDPGTPVRLSLKGSSVPTGRKILSLVQFAGSPWAQTIRLKTDSRENRKKQPYFVVTARAGEQTDQATRERALEVAQAAQTAQYQLTGDTADEKAAKPEKPKGGLDVG